MSRIAKHMPQRHAFLFRPKIGNPSDEYAGADALLPCPGDSKGACCDTNKQGGNCDYCVRDDGCNTCSYALPVPACCAPDTSG